MPPTSGAALGSATAIQTYISFSIRFAANGGIILSQDGSNPERGYYHEEYVFTNIDDALVHVRNTFAATPANN